LHFFKTQTTLTESDCSVYSEDSDNEFDLIDFCNDDEESDDDENNGMSSIDISINDAIKNAINISKSGGQWHELN